MGEGKVHTGASEVAESYDELFAKWIADPKHCGYIVAPEKHYGHRKHSLFLLNLLAVPVDSNKKLLDVACGAGGFLYYAEQRATCFGVDISQVAIQSARKLLQGAKVVVGQAEALPYRDGEFDFITCIGSLEHFMDMDQGLQEMRRVLKENGRLLIEVPNLYSISSIGLALLEGGKGSEDEYQPIGRGGTLWGWRRLLESNGFRVIKAEIYNWRTHPLEFLRPELSLRGGLRLLLRLTSFLIPQNLSENFVYIAEKSNQRHQTLRAGEDLKRKNG